MELLKELLDATGNRRPPDERKMNRHQRRAHEAWLQSERFRKAKEDGEALLRRDAESRASTAALFAEEEVVG